MRAGLSAAQATIEGLHSTIGGEASDDRHDRPGDQAESEGRGEAGTVAAGSTAGPAGRFGAPDRRGEPSRKLWGLTKAGLEAAAGHLGREPDVMGGYARGAGSGGAPHAMAANSTIVAFTRGGTLPGAPAGVGAIDCWRTEVPHPLTSSGKRNVRADAVFQDKAAGVPLLMVDVDRATESVHVLADKVGAYADFYARRVRDPALPSGTGRGTIGDLNTVPVWTTFYQPDARGGRPVPRALGTKAQHLQLSQRQPGRRPSTSTSPAASPW
ncbi:replication-relaxation family protein [Actinacidiphila paucisporea]|uniref:Replication-relaxation n=1 Tax=Actinacidiphila paucisporea TaxID=310782 RepID=A0A1M7R0Q7_9ACTN|nr:replication-relaxation family protein [Actinacidiphila paucisporea]SHN38159.1 Replication-relaxation [Actinacidiphila paucisporea]